ncbi:MAG TPA: DUF6599 family protein [Bryobacteraceae bacterium]|nr:DUF6599 family protein [Bryobacteraceae bacterium]
MLNDVAQAPRRALLLAALFATTLSAAVPTCTLVPGWTQQGEERSYQAENLFEYMDGNAEGYVLYGFQSMRGVTCLKDGVTLVIDVSDFGDADSAFGMFSANRDLRLPAARLGMGGQIVSRRAIFTKGQYYVEVGANPEGDHTVALQAWTAALEKAVEGTSDPPPALAWFPAGQQSLRLVPESVLGIRLLKRGYVGQYDAGKAFVVTESSPESAAALMDKLRARFAGTAAVHIADDAFQMNDRYLGQVCIFRKGRYIAGYGNVAAGQDSVSLAKALAGRLP